jgi:3-hydroxymyristoyl/3-hydroxydecanoyl-(acyl carrier protein) dehydratase
MGLIEKVYPPGLPATQGHFPGNPIVPGAWLLADALASVAAELGWDAARGGACVVKSAKFPAPCRPGETLRIRYTENAGLLNIECTVGDATVLSARITCPPSPAIPKV